MDLGIPTAAYYALGALALAAPPVMLKPRLELSKAKHPSLGGHARLARRVAALVPFYQYEETRFFTADSAPDQVADQRRTDYPSGSRCDRGSNGPRFAANLARPIGARDPS